MEHIEGPINRMLEKANAARKRMEARVKARRVLYHDVEELLEDATEGDAVLDAVGVELVLERLRERWDL
jgi:hypothetical protein